MAGTGTNAAGRLGGIAAGIPMIVFFGGGGGGIEVLPLDGGGGGTDPTPLAMEGLVALGGGGGGADTFLGSGGDEDLDAPGGTDTRSASISFMSAS